MMNVPLTSKPYKATIISTNFNHVPMSGLGNNVIEIYLRIVYLLWPTIVNKQYVNKPVARREGKPVQ